MRIVTICPTRWLLSVLLSTLLATSCAAAVNIDAAWLSAQGPGPYVLDQAGTTYVLQTNVVTVGTAFVVLGGGITLNLNQHTVTYGNSPPAIVVNGGFEQGSGRSVPGWSLTGAPAASLVPNATFLFGNQVLRFSAFSSPQTIVSNAIPVTQVGHTYVASITPSGQLVDYGATLTLTVVDTVTNAVLGTGTCSDQIQRGFSAVAQFTPATSHPVELQIVATPPAGSSTTMDIDAAVLSVSYDYGIMASGDWSGDLPGAGSGFNNLPSAVQTLYSADWTQVTDFTVTNGSIVQGQGNGSYSSPLFLQSGRGVTVDQVSTSDSGLDTTNVDVSNTEGSSGAITITNSTFQDTAPNVANRMAGPATIGVGGASGSVLIQHDTVVGSPQTGIDAAGDQTGPITIDGNDVSQNSNVSDAGGIAVVACRNFAITNNTIHPLCGQGIHIDGYSSDPSDHGIIQNNVVTTSERPNRETGTSEIARAFRMRNDVDLEGPQTNIDISNNSFSTTVGPGLTTTCYTAWFSEANHGGAMNNANISLHDNHITAIASVSDPALNAQALVIDQADPGINLVFSSNILESNGTSLGIGGYNDGNVNDVQLLGTTFRKSTQGAARPYTAVEVGFDVSALAGVSIIDPILDQGAAWTLWWTGSAPKTLMTGWSVGALVIDQAGHPVTGATVNIANAAGTMVATGTTAGAGTTVSVPVVTLVQRQAGSDPTSITGASQVPLTISASANGASAHVTASPTAPTQVTITLPITVATASNAAYVSQSVPTTMTAGQTYPVSVTMTDTGTSTWTASGGYTLGSQNPSDNATWGGSRVLLGPGDSIAPGQSKTFSWMVTAPSSPGTYHFQWQMVQEGVTWFGAMSTDVAVAVVAAPPPAAGIAQGSFETPVVGSGSWNSFRYDPSGSAWTFAGTSGIAGNGSGFTSGNPAAPDGVQVAFLQENGSFSQQIGLAGGSYLLSFVAAQRVNYQPGHQEFTLLIDGAQIGGAFDPSGGSYQAFTSVPFTLAAGTHVIRFLGTDPDGGDHTAFIDRVMLTAGTGNGLLGQYWSNQTGTFTGSPTLTRTDPTVDFNWGTGSPDPSISSDHFSVRWTGYVKPPSSGTWSFSTLSDDGVRLWVNGQEIINNWTDHSATTNTGSIALTAGTLYPITMEYYEDAGDAVATLSWSSGGTTSLPVAVLATAGASATAGPIRSDALYPSELTAAADDGAPSVGGSSRCGLGTGISLLVVLALAFLRWHPVRAKPVA